MATAEQQRAYSMIARFGSVQALRRGATDRAAMIGELDFDPRTRSEVIDGARRMLIAAAGLDPAPNHEVDLVIAFGETLRIIEPVKGPRPAGVPIYYEVVCLKL